MNQVQERVARGAAWLDRKAPGWELKIDLGDLDMASCTHCVLGQVFGKFQDAHRYTPEEYGFEADWMDGKSEPIGYRSLAEEWTRVVKDRLDLGVSL